MPEDEDADPLEGLTPEFRIKVDVFLALAADAGFSLRVVSGYRTPEQQQAVYERGRTRPGRAVTRLRGLPECESKHCSGRAIDVVDRIRGYAIDWETLGAIGESAGMFWGGRSRSFEDKPHFEDVDEA